MKKWHMEGIICMERRCHKLQIPRPGQRTLWSGVPENGTGTEFFLVKMMRAVRGRVLRHS